MTMGQRILRARQEAGLSQRQLAGTEITRNMLSAIEHDTAAPSLATLKYLSGRLGRPVGYFFGEDTPAVEGHEILMQARCAFDAGEYRRCIELLGAQAPGELLGREWVLLGLLARMALARQALEENRLPYARELLAQVDSARDASPYFTGHRELALLMARAGMAAAVPSEDEALLLRAEAALRHGRYEDAIRYLDACEDRKSPGWSRLRGECAFRKEDWRAAAGFFHRAEDAFDLRQRLEVCYRELEDYKLAYYYATAGKK